MSDLPKITILNVEDYAPSRDATSQILRRAGFEVIEASTGSEAIQSATELHPQLVLLDVKLPDIDGYEVCERLKADPATATIPVLQVSAVYAKGQDKVRGLDSGADSYLIKPVEPLELIATINALLRMRQAEAAQRETEARYELLFENNSLPTWIFDLETFAFLAVNEAAVRTYGYTRAEFLVMTIKDIRPPEDVPALVQYMASIPNGVSNVSQWRHRKKDGTLMDVELVWHELRFRGRHALLALVHDISERKYTEAERERLLGQEKQARAEAEAANRAKDEFLAIVSHELRAPLNAMLGWAKILRTQKVDEETLAHATEVIERSARAQSKLIEDLLDTTRIVRGKLRLEVQPVNLTTVIEAAVDVIRPAAAAKSITVNVALDAQTDVITGDPERLQQVVWNLLSNAVKFTPSGGRIEVHLERADPHMRIRVSDTGQGISAKLLPLVFDRFHQANTSGARRHSGLGLGLSLVRHLVELHGGTVFAESAGEGQGATFTVNLPLRAIRPPEINPALSSARDSTPDFAPSLGGLWALVVDDEADARDLITTLLQQYGARVTTVASAEEALAVLMSSETKSPPDILVSDIGMPNEDGYALIRRVRELEQQNGGRIPAVALTAYGRAGDRIRALSAGFQMHVAKPVEPAELALVIASLTGRAGKGVNA